MRLLESNPGKLSLRGEAHGTEARTESFERARRVEFLGATAVATPLNVTEVAPLDRLATLGPCALAPGRPARDAHAPSTPVGDPSRKGGQGTDETKEGVVWKCRRRAKTTTLQVRIARLGLG